MTDDFEKLAREAAEKFATKRCRTYKNQVFVEETDVVDPDMLDAGIHMAQWARAEWNDELSRVYHSFEIERAVMQAELAMQAKGNCHECQRLWNEAERVKKERDQLKAEIAQLKAQANPIGSSFDEHYKQELLAEVERLKADSAVTRLVLKTEIERLNELVQRYSTSEILMGAVRERDEAKAELERAKGAIANMNLDKRLPPRPMCPDCGVESLTGNVHTDECIKTSELREELERANRRIIIDEDDFNKGISELKVMAVSDSAKISKLESEARLHETIVKQLKRGHAAWSDNLKRILANDENGFEYVVHQIRATLDEVSK